MHAVQKYGYIDALRGYAITGVVLTHCAQAVAPESRWLSTLMREGARGVQLFYVVSVVTLCLSWHTRACKEAHPTRNFYIRRVFRIVPLFLAAIAAHVALFGWGPSYWAPNGIRPWFLPITALCLHGFHPETINGIVPGGWSVAVEVTFYALLPILLRHVTGVLPAIVFAGVACCLSAINYVGTPLLLKPLYPASQWYLVNSFKFFNFLGQLPVFALGFLLFHLMSTRNPVLKATAIALAAIALDLAAEWMGLASLPPDHIVAAAAMLPCVAILGRHPHAVIVNPLIVFLGKVSYGVYLFHYPIILGLKNIVMPQAVGLSDSLCICFASMVFCTSAALAWVVLLAIERPCIQLGGRLIEVSENRRRLCRPALQTSNSSGSSEPLPSPLVREQSSRSSA